MARKFKFTLNCEVRVNGVQTQAEALRFDRVGDAKHYIYNKEKARTISAGLALLAQTETDRRKKAVYLYTDLNNNAILVTYTLQRANALKIKIYNYENRRN